MATQRPVCDKKATDGSCEVTGDAKGCLMQTSVTQIPFEKGKPSTVIRTEATCTECIPQWNTGFMVQFHKSMAGRCSDYDHRAKTNCVPLNTDTNLMDMTR